jgi:hypothetical protein
LSDNGIDLQSLKNELSGIIAQSEPFVYEEVVDAIVKNNEAFLSELENIFKNVDYVNICGKGPSAKTLDDGCGINQGIVFIRTRRILTINDDSALLGLIDVIPEIRYVFCPVMPWSQLGFKGKLNYLHIHSYLSNHGFRGKMLAYENNNSFLKSHASMRGFNVVPILRYSTVCVSIYFLGYVLQKDCRLYGICKEADNYDYHETIGKLCEVTGKKTKWEPDETKLFYSDFRRWLENLSTAFNVKIEIN